MTKQECVCVNMGVYPDCTHVSKSITIGVSPRGQTYLTTLGCVHMCTRMQGYLMLQGGVTMCACISMADLEGVREHVVYLCMHI